VSAAKVGRDLRVQVPGHLSMTISYTREIDVGGLATQLRSANKTQMQADAYRAILVATQETRGRSQGRRWRELMNDRVRWRASAGVFAGSNGGGHTT
jgi:hypothetical protein